MRRQLKRQLHCESLEGRQMLASGWAGFSGWFYDSKSGSFLKPEPAPLVASVQPQKSPVEFIAPPAPTSPPILAPPVEQVKVVPPPPAPVEPMPVPQPSPGGILPGSYYKAPLIDSSSGGRGLASYQSTTSDVITSATFRVTITGAPPNLSYSILVDGAAVGTFNTNAQGYGTFVISTSSGSGAAAATAPPAVQAGSTITVGPFSGTFVSQGQGLR